MHPVYFCIFKLTINALLMRNISRLFKSLAHKILKRSRINRCSSSKSRFISSTRKNRNRISVHCEKKTFFIISNKKKRKKKRIKRILIL